MRYWKKLKPRLNTGTFIKYQMNLRLTHSNAFRRIYGRWTDRTEICQSKLNFREDWKFQLEKNPSAMTENVDLFINVGWIWIFFKPEIQMSLLDSRNRNREKYGLKQGWKWQEGFPHADWLQYSKQNPCMIHIKVFISRKWIAWNKSQIKT